MKTTVNKRRGDVIEELYECEATGLKIRKIKDGITEFDFNYILTPSGGMYAVTEECADDLIKTLK